MKEETKNKINKFLKQFFAMKDPEDLGLIVVDNKEERPNASFWEEIKWSYLKIENPSNFDDLLNQIVVCQKIGNNLVFDIQIDLSPTIISTLKEISTLGTMNIHNDEGKTVDTVVFSPKVKILAIVDRDLINTVITYDNFYDVFNSTFFLD